MRIIPNERHFVAPQYCRGADATTIRDERWAFLYELIASGGRYEPKLNVQLINSVFFLVFFLSFASERVVSFRWKKKRESRAISTCQIHVAYETIVISFSFHRYRKCRHEKKRIFIHIVRNRATIRAVNCTHALFLFSRKQWVRGICVSVSVFCLQFSWSVAGLSAYKLRVRLCPVTWNYSFYWSCSAHKRKEHASIRRVKRCRAVR